MPSSWRSDRLFVETHILRDVLLLRPSDERGLPSLHRKLARVRGNPFGGPVRMGRVPTAGTVGLGAARVYTGKQLTIV